MDLHPLLLRQLRKLNLSEKDITPENLLQWYDFIQRVNRSYCDNDQDRYLLERSMDISSKELMDTNNKLETAQEIAHLGYWLYDNIDNKITWSKETFNLFGIDPKYGEPNFDECMELVHENDRTKLTSLIERSFMCAEPYQYEFQMLNKNQNTYRWYYAKGQPVFDRYFNETGKVRSISGIVIDIHDRKESEKEIIDVNRKLIMISKQAGMLEVTSFFMHNIGNILNSANVSIEYIADILSSSKVNRLVKAALLVNDRFKNTSKKTHPENKDQLIVDYINQVVESITSEYKDIIFEVNNITKHLNHIKNIVVMQCDLVSVSGKREKISVDDLVQMALQLSTYGKNEDIRITTHIIDNVIFIIDKSITLQIMINLIKNAVESILEYRTSKDGQIAIAARVDKNTKQLFITVSDNGCGIEADAISRIFTQGYTTKKNGHGFGLHGSSIAAKELGGQLVVKSKGHGHGAEFTLIVPVYESVDDGRVVTGE
jgi:PAS domain S-box-containing protein